MSSSWRINSPKGDGALQWRWGHGAALQQFFGPGGQRAQGWPVAIVFSELLKQQVDVVVIDFGGLEGAGF